MLNEYTLVLTSEALLEDFQRTIPIQQKNSIDGWVSYQTRIGDIWFRKEDHHGETPPRSEVEPDHQWVVLSDDYLVLQPWIENGCKTIWLNRAGDLIPVEYPAHDLEIHQIEQLDDIRSMDRSPSLGQCFKWWEEWNLPENVRRHVSKVAWAAYMLACLLVQKGEKVDPILTHRGGLLHDLDKIETLSEVNRHGQMSGEFLDAQGYPEVAEILRGHILHTILDPNSDARPWEVKLVYFCDKLTEGDRIVTLGERFSALGERYPAYIKKMGRAKTHVWGLNDHLCSILSIPDNEHLVAFLNAAYREVRGV